jgi:hypothetical protein
MNKIKIGILSCLMALSLNGVEIDSYKSIKPCEPKPISNCNMAELLKQPYINSIVYEINPDKTINMIISLPTNEIDKEMIDFIQKTIKSVETNKIIKKIYLDISINQNIDRETK